MMVFLKSLALLALLWTGSALANDRADVERAIANSDLAALRLALRQNPAAPDSYFLQFALLRATGALLGAAERADQGGRNRARDMIREIMAAGASIDQPFSLPSFSGGSSFMAITRIARIPGERDFMLELLARTEPAKRCAIAVDVAEWDFNLWGEAMAVLALVPEAEKASATCLNLFRLAGHGVDSNALVNRLIPLFSADMMVRPKDAPNILDYLPATADGRDIIARILQNVDLDQRLPRDTFPHAEGYGPESLFAYLLGESVDAGDRPLRANLAAMPLWHALLSRKAPHDGACSSRNIAYASSSWSNYFPAQEGEAEDGEAEKSALRHAATLWLIRHCDPNLLSGTSWEAMIRQGGGDLVVEATHRGVNFSDPESVLRAAFCQSNDIVAIALLQRRREHADLDMFFHCLRALENQPANGGDAKILSWLLAHGADPNAVIAGASPLTIAIWFDRDDIALVLGQAGATPSAPFTEESKRFWLFRRLLFVAGFPIARSSSVDEVAGEQNLSLTEVDLDGDDELEYIIQGECGAVNCAIAVVHRSGRHWRIVLDSAGDSIEPMIEGHNGWTDLTVTARGSPAMFATTIFHFDGTRYRPAVCSETSFTGDVPETTELPCKE